MLRDLVAVDEARGGERGPAEREEQRQQTDVMA
jgi:hypothetical protein